MTPSVDHQFDKSDQALIFKSSDGKTFSISKEIASISLVWKDMLQVSEKMTTSDPISLAEKEDELLVFFTVPQNFGRDAKLPEILSDLKCSSLMKLLEMADKYGRIIVGLFAQQEVLMNFHDGKIREGEPTTTQILTIFFYAQQLELEVLINTSAKLTLKIKDLVMEMPEEIDFFTIKEHLRPLLKFRNRWEKQKSEILAGNKGYRGDDSEVKDFMLFTPQMLKQKCNFSSSEHQVFGACSCRNCKLTDCKSEWL